MGYTPPLAGHSWRPNSRSVYKLRPTLPTPRSSFPINLQIISEVGDFKMDLGIFCQRWMNNNYCVVL
ncbi:hypothetical protein L6452_12551 [Arctium lappa]|uniref:Uncharacterized protein n=1 Tax=Arctium lappa TaxID=4217 RepID=A0ACB9DR34_ARCLA|nr:hypothetical protein L6452_12551 [Arctium lappa]